MLQPNIEVNQNPELAQLVQQAANGSRAIGLSLNGDQQAVILSLEAFKSLTSRISTHSPSPTQDEFRQQCHTALSEAGFDTREQILDLMRDIRCEVANDWSILLTWKTAYDQI